MNAPAFDIKMQRICVPTDFSDSADHALDYATALARKFGAELHLVHVLDDWMDVVRNPDFTGKGVSVHEYLKAREQGATDYLAQLAAKKPWQGLKVETAWRYGNIVEAVLHYATHYGIDLIVTGTHGRTGLKHLLLGSVAERLVRLSHCPVLTVRHPSFGFLISKEPQTPGEPPAA